MQLVYFSIQHIHELLQLALHVDLLLLTVVYVQLKTIYPPLQLLVPGLGSLGKDDRKKTITSQNIMDTGKSNEFLMRDIRAIEASVQLCSVALISREVKPKTELITAFVKKLYKSFSLL